MMPPGVRQRLKRRNTEERREERRGLSLRELAVKQATIRRYKKALVKGLNAWNFSSIAMLDLDIAEYIEYAFEEGESIGHISDFLCGLQMFVPVLRRRLSQAWHMFKVWKKVERNLQATPLPPNLLRAMMGYCLKSGALDFLLLLCLGYFALLRTGELMTLRCKHLQLSSGCALVYLAETKTGNRENRQEHVVIRQPQALAVIKAFLRTRGEEDAYIWQLSSQKFRESFSLLLDHFNVGGLGFRPYSLRRGGATSLYRQGWPTENILILGRWKSTASARTYIDDGLTQQASLQFSSKVLAKIACFTKHFPEFL